MASDHGICRTPGTPGKGLDASSNLERRPPPGVGELKSSWFPDSRGQRWRSVRLARSRQRRASAVAQRTAIRWLLAPPRERGRH